MTGKGRVAVFLFAAASVFAKAQSSGPFASYDCRPEEELIRYTEARQRAALERRLLDSLIRAEIYALIHEVYALPVTEDTLNGWKYWKVAENYAFGKDRGNLPMITSLEALHPYFRDKVIELIARAKKAGIELAVVETFRTCSKQMEYKSMGRKYTRTGAGASKHQYGLAVDVVPLVNGEPQWHNRALWYKVGIIGERLGLRWGGRWRNPYDPGHFEWTGGLSSAELAQGKLPVPPNTEKHYPCLEDDLRLLKKYWQAWETTQSRSVVNKAVPRLSAAAK